MGLYPTFADALSLAAMFMILGLLTLVKDVLLSSGDSSGSTIAALLLTEVCRAATLAMIVCYAVSLIVNF